MTRDSRTKGPRWTRFQRGRRAGLFLCCAVLIAGGPGRADNVKMDAVIVLANENVPDSLALADYYMEKREIPAENLVRFDLPETETISRSTYEEKLRDPLLEFLRQGDFIEQQRREAKNVGEHESPWLTQESRVGYAVCLYGMPLRIADLKPALARKIATKFGQAGRSNTAALDSELAALLTPPQGIDGPIRNPLYATLTRAEGGHHGRFVILAARLDAPTPAQVRDMIDDALYGERYGLLGKAFFDVRGIRDQAYIAGDYWIQKAYHRMEQEGFDCVMEQTNALFASSYPMAEAAYYMGWYTEHAKGPFMQEGFSFQPGALAYHIHSSSASTIRSTDRQWVGPLIDRGAAATMGAVHEPYLRMTVNIDIFTDRLCSGYTFGESAYMALPSLSWQMTVVGDPLYKPFKYSLETQIEHLEKDRIIHRDWAYNRRVNQLVRQGRFNIALDYCRQKIEQTRSPVLREKLADLYAMNNLFEEAFVQYEAILAQTDSDRTGIRVGARWLLILRMLNRTEEAEELEARLRARWPESPFLPWLETARP